MSLAAELAGLGSIGATERGNAELKSFGEIDEEDELAEVTDELKIVGLMSAELEMLGLGVIGIGNMLNCGVAMTVGEVVVVGVFIAGAVVRST